MVRRSCECRDQFPQDRLRPAPAPQAPRPAWPGNSPDPRAFRRNSRSSSIAISEALGHDTFGHEILRALVAFLLTIDQPLRGANHQIRLFFGEVFDRESSHTSVRRRIELSSASASSAWACFEPCARYTPGFRHHAEPFDFHAFQLGHVNGLRHQRGSSRRQGKQIDALL